jgi:hypothetical protein
VMNCRAKLSCDFNGPKVGDPGRIRTCDLQLRRLLLYPLSYGAVFCFNDLVRVLSLWPIGRSGHDALKYQGPEPVDRGGCCKVKTCERRRELHGAKLLILSFVSRNFL